MNISVSPAGITNPRVPRQGLQDIADAGFHSIFLEMGMCCPPQELERAGMADKEEAGQSEGVSAVEQPGMLGLQFARMEGQCREKGLGIPVARAPYLLRETKRTDLWERMMQIHEESVRYCGTLGCGYLVVRPWQEHTGFALPKTSLGSEWEANRTYYLRLAAIAREHRVMLLLENQCRWVNGHLVRGVCSDGREAAEWIDRLNEETGEERFGFCMDVGVCNLCGQDMHEFACALGSRIKAVILRDCDGHQENSLLPFTCSVQGKQQTDWLGLIRGLRDISFDGELVMDMSGTAAGFSPLLRPHLISLAKATAEYFCWQAGIEAQLKKNSLVVLFGAGNMCRNYMKCYGEKYPPLFTCDNNEKLWGTSFCGLEVKPPKALKKLPQGCVVLICNIYYREIERQLRELGVENIGFFNDEYMPSFYFDRLKEV